MAQASHSADTERAELETVLDALARNPRLANLLRYLADRYLQGRSAEITEYNIATEVFGRSKKTFDGSTDSIARVEAYRLRKWLKEYYEKRGRDHAIQISVPYRSYIPEFTRQAGIVHTVATSEPQADTPDREDLATEAVANIEHTQNAAERETAETAAVVQPSRRKWTLAYSVAAIAVLLLLSFGAVRFFSRKSSDNSYATGSASLPNANQSPMPANPAHVPLRLLAGYQGTPRVDGAGDYWESDRYFIGGTAFRRPDAPVVKTSDPMLFDYWRTSDFAYNIPLAPGPYELHLFFVASPQDDPKSSFFNVSVNGQMLLRAFNIGFDALGTNIADERVFKDICPDKDGILHLKFLQERSSPSLNALEILSGLPHRQLPVRLVMQRAAVKDHDGNIWHPDNYFQNGMISDPPRRVDGTLDPGLYAQERYGHFTYSIPVDSRGRYTLVLHFAELYWVPNSPDSVGAGTRLFRIYCNGSTLLDNFDILKEAGSLHALTRTFKHLRPTPEGKLDLTFEPVANYATVSAIEVIDESE
jgi:Malectin domain